MFLKKSFAIAILAVMTVCASAQDFKKFRFGPTVGLNLASNTAKEVKPKVGFSIGALGEYNFTNNFYMTSALKLSLKNSKLDGTEFDKNDKTKVKKVFHDSYKPYYFEIPIHAGYRYSFNDKFSVFGELGPYIGIGVCGKAYSKETKYDVYVEEKVYNGRYVDIEDVHYPEISKEYTIDYFGDFKDRSTVGANRFDFGLGFAAGIEFSKFQARLGYDFGLTKIFDVENSARNRNFYIALSYMF